MVNRLLTVTIVLIISSCGLDSVEEAKINYPTTPAFKVPDNIQWMQVGHANELLNIKENLVVVSGGNNEIPKELWEDFKPRIPWQKNINRHLLIDSTVFLRSPNAPSNCKGENCLEYFNYKEYSWIKLASPVAVDYVPSKTDLLEPEEGHLVVKVIKKCQIVAFENEIYQMSDDKGNKYVMHATETGQANLDVVLPTGFKIEKVQLNEPLVIVPFGDKEDCYFNIVGDHLGQGYHQYVYAGDTYPNK